MPDLYDKLKANPDFFLEVENEQRAKINRGSKLNPRPVKIVLIPDRDTLRERIERKYGIKNIDKYFIPILVDHDTYREIKGKKEASFLSKEWLEETLRVEGHVKKVNNFFISYIDTRFGAYIDQAIEHEAIHAYILGKNPHYSNMSPNFGFGIASPTLDIEKLNWVEIISYISTMPKKEIDKMVKKDNLFFVSGLKQIKGNPNKIKKGIIFGMLASPLVSTIESLEKIIDRKIFDVPYAIGRNFIQVISSTAYLKCNFNKIIKNSNESFHFAYKLRKHIGLKRFIKETSEKSREELVEKYGELLH
jgi:hypothetical protein